MARTRVPVVKIECENGEFRRRRKKVIRANPRLDVVENQPDLPRLRYGVKKTDWPSNSRLATFASEQGPRQPPFVMWITLRNFRLSHSSL